MSFPSSPKRDVKPENEEMTVEESPRHGLRKDRWKQLTRVSIPAISGDKRPYGSWKAAFMVCVDTIWGPTPSGQFALRGPVPTDSSWKAKDLDRLADLPDVIVINRKKAGKKEELGNGSLNMKVQQKMTSAMLANNNRWVFEQKKVACFETLHE